MTVIHCNKQGDNLPEVCDFSQIVSEEYVSLETGLRKKLSLHWSQAILLIYLKLIIKGNHRKVVYRKTWSKTRDNIDFDSGIFRNSCDVCLLN